MVIYKYPIGSSGMRHGQTEVRLPAYWELVEVGEQDRALYAWVCVKDEGELVSTCTFEIIFTGEELDPAYDTNRRFVRTIFHSTGLVLHIFARTQNPEWHLAGYRKIP